MNNILFKIIENKKEEIARKKQQVPINLLMEKVQSQKSKSRGLTEAILLPQKGEIALIAEIKLVSPSEGVLGDKSMIPSRVKAYEEAGADAISVVVDEKFFRGSLDFISQIKDVVQLPVLAKDFMIDSYQLYEAKLAGADAVLFITKIVERKKLIDLVSLAEKLGLEPVVEINDEKELEVSLSTSTRLIAVNARDLSTFTVDVNRACQLGKLIPKTFVFLGFSGVKTRSDVVLYQQAGARAVLVGTSLMKTENISILIKELKGL